MSVIKKFDPWESTFCTCPKKYTLNPYTGCSHRCVYCYITSYIPNAFNLRLKSNILNRVKKDAEKIDNKHYISLSNSSDPYPPEERKYLITRRILEIFSSFGLRTLIVTKSDLVLRDIDLLNNLSCSVSLSVTSLDNRISKKLEPGAPLPKERVSALKALSREGIRCSVRLDPIIPGINDKAISNIIDAVSDSCEHLVASTVKFRKDGYQRFTRAFPSIKLEFEGIFHNSYYLKQNLRLELLQKVKDKCEQYGITFASCREGFPELSNSICDGSQLIG
ncbi:MAG TPA: radical SAM protein [Thermoplasmata archaeon]|nr:radical SAM protein [Thermoplasmata archaeon]